MKYLLFLACIILFSCNDTTSFDKEHDISSEDTVTIQDVQGNWLLVRGKYVFDSIEVLHSFNDIVSIKDSTIFTTSFDGFTTNNHVDEFISHMYYKNNVITKKADGFTFHNSGPRGGVYHSFIPFNGDTAAVFIKDDSLFIDEYRFPENLWGSWYESRELYISGSENSGDSSSYFSDTTFESIATSKVLVVLTPDSVFRYRKDSEGVKERRMCHYDWSHDSDWDAAKKIGEQVKIEFADYEGGNGSNNYWGCAGFSVYSLTSDTIPPETWYE